MNITRFDTQSHQLNASVINVSYDRWTGRFTLTTDLIQTNANHHDEICNSPTSTKSRPLAPVNIKRVLSTKNIFFNPFSHMAFRLNGIDYLVSVSWFMIWRSSVFQTNSLADANQSTVSISELLPRRHRRSIILCSYVAVITSIKLGLMLFLA